MPDYLKPVAPATYNESMSLACQFGKCELCPAEWTLRLRPVDAGDGCSCICHIPDDPPRGLDEDCADGLHEYCLTDGCTCVCHIPDDDQ